jgi:hypothetical protein
MAKIEVFEDLKVWQDARILVKHIYALSQQKAFAKYYVLFLVLLFPSCQILLKGLTARVRTNLFSS